MNMFTVHTGDALTTLASLPDESVHCCVTSPPYPPYNPIWLVFRHEMRGEQE